MHQSENIKIKLITIINKDEYSWLILLYARVNENQYYALLILSSPYVAPERVEVPEGHDLEETLFKTKTQMTTLFELRDKKTLYVNRLEGELTYGRDLLVKHVNDKDISEILKRVSQSTTLLKDLSETLDNTNEKLSLTIDPSEEEQFEKEVDKDFSMIISAVECRHDLESLQSNVIDRKFKTEIRQSAEKEDRQFNHLLHRQAKIQIFCFEKPRVCWWKVCSAGGSK